MFSQPLRRSSVLRPLASEKKTKTYRNDDFHAAKATLKHELDECLSAMPIDASLIRPSPLQAFENPSSLRDQKPN